MVPYPSLLSLLKRLIVYLAQICLDAAYSHCILMHLLIDKVDPISKCIFSKFQVDWTLFFKKIKFKMIGQSIMTMGWRESTFPYCFVSGMPNPKSNSDAIAVQELYKSVSQYPSTLLIQRITISSPLKPS